MKEYPKKLKQEVINQHTSGVSVAEISESLSITRSTVYEWIKQSEKNTDSKFTKSNFRLLENKIKRLEVIIEILQNVECTASAPLDEKFDAPEQMYGKYSVHMLCNALKVSRGTRLA